MEAQAQYRRADLLERERRAYQCWISGRRRPARGDGAAGAALAAFGLITAGAIPTGAWFGPIAWPRPQALVHRGHP